MDGIRVDSTSSTDKLVSKVISTPIESRSGWLTRNSRLPYTLIFPPTVWLVLLMVFRAQRLSDALPLIPVAVNFSCLSILAWERNPSRGYTRGRGDNFAGGDNIV